MISRGLRIDVDARLAAREVRYLDGGLAFVLGDVSGKGIPASMFMVRAISLARLALLGPDTLGVEAVQQRVKSMQDAYCAPLTHIAGVRRSARMPGGVVLRT